MDVRKATHDDVDGIRSVARASLEASFDKVKADGIRAGVFNLFLAQGWVPPEGLAIPGSG